ncbi:MAG TPA: hypothetical protein PLP49_00240 [Anaerohalosphaeraceae bacterium]|jgi:hypothetical protein|nr:hypothetical protein [Anaerohalosphaeraceae bacterium]HPB92538.1 hypothetical protein [Anaerohalosphaeraceae bacterium]HRT22484.1 hypothetical protein [Anaerohalosphaeraceae bacterium]
MNSPEINRTAIAFQKYRPFESIHRFRRAIRTIALLIILGCAGCGGFFEKRSTEMEAARVLKELREIQAKPQMDNPIPDLYLQPPSRLEIKEGVKVFYFTHHHSADYLAQLVREQMDIQALPHGATNQLILYCGDHSQADAVLAYLEKVDVPPVQVNVDCLILERFGDVTMDWETSVFIENFLGENLTLGEKLATFYEGQSGGKHYAVRNGQLFEINPAQYPSLHYQPGELIALEPAFPGASLRETERANFGGDFGYWINRGKPGHQVRAVLDVLVSRGYLKILLNPTLETVNGKQATVMIRDYTPVEKVKTGLGGASDAYNITEYVWVEDTLTVTPTVYSDGSVGLATSIKIGSRSKPEGVVQRSIITERSIEIAENRVRPGESLIIGGMRKTEKRSVVRGVPFFKDLPLIGYLFSSKDFEEKGTEIFFILTPSISSGGKPFEVATEDIRRKFEKPTLESAQEWNLLEPFEGGSYRQVIEKRAAELETRRVKAEAQREEALRRLQEEKRHFQSAVEEARKLRQEAMTLQEQAVKAQQEAQQAIEAAAAAEQQQKAQQEQTTDLSEAVQKALDEARLKQAQLQQAQQRAAEAEEKARQEEEAVRQIQEELKQFEQQEKESPPPGPETAPSPSLDN